MEFDHGLTARALMQAIDILRHERELRHAPSQFHEREVAGVRPRPRDEVAQYLRVGGV